MSKSIRSAKPEYVEEAEIARAYGQAPVSFEKFRSEKAKQKAISAERAAAVAAILEEVAA